MEPSSTTKASFSIPSILALIAAIASLFVGALPGFLLAALAIVCAVVGIAMSLSPTVRGGVTSTLALILAVLGIVLALFRALGGLFRGHGHF